MIAASFCSPAKRAMTTRGSPSPAQVAKVVGVGGPSASSRDPSETALVKQEVNNNLADAPPPSPKAQLEQCPTQVRSPSMRPPSRRQTPRTSRSCSDGRRLAHGTRVAHAWRQYARKEHAPLTSEMCQRSEIQRLCTRR